MDILQRAQHGVLYSIYWVFWGEVEKKEVRKGKIVATNVQASALAYI